jgi:nucleoside-diphosphate-sugar epimerase
VNILVTGASGLVGDAICRFFLKEGFNVTGIVMSASAGISHERFKEFKMDLTNSKISFSTSFDAVIHCSAVIPNNKSQKSDEELYLINQKIDQTVFSYCLESKIKLIYISTAYLYDCSANELLGEESFVSKDLKGYYKSKRDSENFLQLSVPTATILRISSPYGFIDRQNNVMKLFSEKLKNNLPITLIGKGERKQNFIHIEDIANACFKAIKNETGGVFNTCDDRSYTMLELASFIKGIYKSNSELIFDTNTSEASVNVNFDISKINRMLRWQPKIDLETGLRKTLLN